MNLLLLSNSTNFGEEYLEYPKEAINNFLNGIKKNIVFIPYAGVTFSWDDYTDKVNESLRETGIRVNGLHASKDPVKSIENADAIMVGGGNSFQLLHLLYKHKLVDVINEKVQSGVPYIGWSAGSNMACPTLKTTNDMPIIEPISFRALNLIPFQINPHYTEATIQNHGGESREARILEFLEVNRGETVIGLPEGMIIKLTNGSYELIGCKPVKIFQFGKDPYFISTSDELNNLIN